MQTIQEQKLYWPEIEISLYVLTLGKYVSLNQPLDILSLPRKAQIMIANNTKENRRGVVMVRTNDKIWSPEAYDFLCRLTNG